MGGNTYTITPAELARLTGKTPAAIHRLAHRFGWRRTHTRPVHYFLDDVIDTMSIPVSNP